MTLATLMFIKYNSSKIVSGTYLSYNLLFNLESNSYIKLTSFSKVLSNENEKKILFYGVYKL